MSGSDNETSTCNTFLKDRLSEEDYKKQGEKATHASLVNLGKDLAKQELVKNFKDA